MICGKKSIHMIDTHKMEKVAEARIRPSHYIRITENHVIIKHCGTKAKVEKEWTIISLKETKLS
jgi:hypothetical protein